MGNVNMFFLSIVSSSLSLLLKVKSVKREEKTMSVVVEEGKLQLLTRADAGSFSKGPLRGAIGAAPKNAPKQRRQGPVGGRGRVVSWPRTFLAPPTPEQVIEWTSVKVGWVVELLLLAIVFRVMRTGIILRRFSHSKMRFVGTYTRSFHNFGTDQELAVVDTFHPWLRRVDREENVKGCQFSSRVLLLNLHNADDNDIVLSGVGILQGKTLQVFFPWPEALRSSNASQRVCSRTRCLRPIATWVDSLRTACRP